MGQNLLDHIVQKGRAAFSFRIRGLEEAGMPPRCLRIALDIQVRATMEYGVELVINVPGFETKLDGLLSWWLHQLWDFDCLFHVE